MNERYRICIITPSGYKHSSAFLEVALLLKCALSDCGLRCDMAVNEPLNDATNVILGYHLISDPAVLSGTRYIPYQLEQLSMQEGVYSDKNRRILAGAAEVWDYSLENRAFLRRSGIAAQHLPLGFHEALERIAKTDEKDIDILFYGSMNERRKRILDALAGCFKVKALFGVYGNERDAWIGRSRLVVNIHHYEAKIFEAVRLSYLMNNGIFFVSEDSALNPYPDIPICMAPYDKIVDLCKYYMENQALASGCARSVYEAFKTKYRMTDLLNKIL